MSRTKKDITINGRTIDDARTIVQKWFGENKISTIESTSNSIKGRWGTGFLTAAKYFQVTFVPTEGGLIAQTEGWMTWYWLKEQDFSASALGGAIPRREGWRAMERLWTTLQSP